MLSFRPLFIFALWGLFFQLGCAMHEGPDAAAPSLAEYPQDLGEDALRAAYAHALEDARFPNASKVSTSLVPLTPATPELAFNDQGHVLMVTFTKSIYYKDYQPGQAFSLYGETWLTAWPFLQEFCSAYQGDNLLLRLQQLLGLPPKTENHNDVMVGLWVDPAHLFRPCPDPEVTDRECVPSLSGSRDAERQTPWYWGSEPQLSGAFVTVSATHLDWLFKNWLSRYQPPELYQRYPWTALGYTYDWGNATDPVGMSEFVALGGTPVVFESMTPIDAYCGR